MADRSVFWTGLTPDLVNGVTSAWLDADRVALTIRPGGDLPWLLRFDGTGQAEMDRRWTRTAEGREPSRTRIETRLGRVTTDAVAPAVRLVVLDVTTGVSRELAEGAIRDFAPSPAGDRIALLTSGERVGRIPLGTVVQSAVQTRSRLSFVDVATGDLVPVNPDLDVAPHLLRWSAEGDAVLVWARRDGEPWEAAGLVALSPAGGLRQFGTDGLRPFEEGRTVDEVRVVQADWLGRDAVLRARPADSDRFDWWRVGEGPPRPLTRGLTSAPTRVSAAAGAEVLAFADGRLWALGGPDDARPITEAGGDLVDGRTHTLMTPFRLMANEAPRQGWVAARSGDTTRILGEGGAAGVWSSQRCDGTLLGRSAVRTAVLTLCLDQGVETLALAAPGVDRVLDRVNADFAEVAVPVARPAPHLDPWGRPVTSQLFLPPGYEGGRLKGLIVLVYPGVVETGRYVEATSLQTQGPRAQLLASEGYAVLSAAVPGEEQTTRAAMFDDFARATDLAIDAALALEPGLPADRIALLGHSFGGYTALAIATRSPPGTGAWWRGRRPRIPRANGGAEAARSGVAGVCSDPRLEFGRCRERPGEPGRSALVRRRGLCGRQPLSAGGPDHRAPAADHGRPGLCADGQRPTHDGRHAPAGEVGPAGDLLGETHSHASPANIRDVYREIFDWLDRTLGEEGVTPRTGDAPMPEPSPRSRPLS